MEDFREETAAVQLTLTLRASLHPRVKRRRRVEGERAQPVPQAVSVTTRITRTSPQALPAAVVVVVVGTAALVYWQLQQQQYSNPTPSTLVLTPRTTTTEPHHIQQAAILHSSSAQGVPALCCYYFYSCTPRKSSPSPRGTDRLSSLLDKSPRFHF